MERKMNRSKSRVSFRTAGALLGAAVSLIVFAGAASAQPNSKLALVGGMLLDGYEVPPLHHAAVLIEGDRIVAVGRASELEIPQGYTVIDTRGRTMLPGLIDLHAHLMILGHGDYATWFPWLEKAGHLSSRSWRFQLDSC